MFVLEQEGTLRWNQERHRIKKRQNHLRLATVPVQESDLPFLQLLCTFFSLTAKSKFNLMFVCDEGQSRWHTCLTSSAVRQGQEAAVAAALAQCVLHPHV